MSERRPIISDPRHLAALTGSAWLVLRPGVEVTAEFGRLQRSLGGDLRGEDVSYPGPHVSVQGFQDQMEASVVPAVDAWAAATAPLTIRPVRLTSFPTPDQIAILEVEANPALRDSLHRIRREAASRGLVVFSEIAADKW